jgi:hypothetical protein
LRRRHPAAGGRIEVRAASPDSLWGLIANQRRDSGIFHFEAFSLREPVSTSLENALIHLAGLTTPENTRPVAII